MSVLEVDVRKHHRTGTKGFMIVQVSVSESLRASQPHPSHFLLAWRDRFLATICRLYSLYSSNDQQTYQTSGRTIWTLKTKYIDPIYSNPRLKNLLNTLLKPVETLEPRNRNNNSIRPSNMEKAPLVANPIHTSNSGLRHLRTNKTEDVFLLAVLRGQALQ